jgi:hypothetical protein
VWIVSNEQLLAWVRNPVPLSQLNDFGPLKCSTPAVDQKICNGMPENEAGLLSHCAFSDFPFYTCVRCLTPWQYTQTDEALFATVWVPVGTTFAVECEPGAGYWQRCSTIPPYVTSTPRC